MNNRQDLFSIVARVTGVDLLQDALIEIEDCVLKSNGVEFQKPWRDEEKESKVLEYLEYLIFCKFNDLKLYRFAAAETGDADDVFEFNETLKHLLGMHQNWNYLRRVFGMAQPCTVSLEDAKKTALVLDEKVSKSEARFQVGKLLKKQ